MDIRAILMGLIFALMWASAFTSARMIVADAPPLTALSIRFLLSGMIALGIAWALGQSLRLTRTQWIATAIFGLCQNALYLGLNFVAMQWVEASLATIIASTMPLWVALFGLMFLGERVPLLGAAGLIAGFIGVTVIMGARISGGVDLFGIMLCALGVLSLATATMLLKTASSGGNLLTIIGLQMVIGGGCLAVAAIPLETWEVNWTPRLGLAFTYTLLVPGLLATWVWFLLVQRIGTVKAATFHFLTPPFGVAVAHAVLGEPVSALDMVGVGIVALGILAVQLSKQV
jgi:drug/metabolite transporter (DMT)-like permease